jgi:hypothetical protein
MLLVRFLKGVVGALEILVSLIMAFARPVEFRLRFLQLFRSLLCQGLGFLETFFRRRVLFFRSLDFAFCCDHLVSSKPGPLLSHIERRRRTTGLSQSACGDHRQHNHENCLEHFVVAPGLTARLKVMGEESFGAGSRNLAGGLLITKDGAG